jgi:hypothetical protein
MDRAAAVDANVGAAADAAASGTPGLRAGSIVPKRVRVSSIHASAPSGRAAGVVL